MATHDYVIANASGAAVRQDLNNALAAIVSNNSSDTEPGTTYAHMLWLDTANDILKIRNAANNAWIDWITQAGTPLIPDGTVGAPGLAFASETDSGLYRIAANTLGVATSGTERIEIGDGGIVINEGGADSDIRIEGDNEPNLLVVDAGNDRIGIGDGAPGTTVEIHDAEPRITVRNTTEEDTAGGRETRLIFEGEQSGAEISTLAEIEASHEGTADDEKGQIVIRTNDGSDGASPTAALTIGSDQTVAVADNLTVNGNQYPTAGALSHRNIIINGAMRIVQRGSSETGVTTSTYGGPDRWRTDIGTAGTWTISRSTTAPDGFGYSFKFDCTTAKASLDAGSALVFDQRIEGQNLQGLKKGIAAAESVTLSFWVRSNKTGTYIIELNDNDNTRAISRSYTIDSANTWEYKSITVPGDTTGAFDDDAELSLFVNWWLAAGTNFSSGTLATSWVARTDANRAVGQVNLADSTDNEWYVTGVQLEIGTKATPFEYRNITEDFILCQRYYQRGRGTLYVYYPSSATLESFEPFKVTMRATPTSASISSATNLGNGFSTSTTLVDNNGIKINFPASAAGFNGARVVYLVDAEL